MISTTHKKILDSGDYASLTVNTGEYERAIRLFKFMLRLRICEERLAEEYHPADQMRCPIHFCVGQESVPAVLSDILEPKDYLFSHHRSHGYYLAKNAPMRQLFAELYGKSTGANGGFAGSQDISFSQTNFYAGAILAGAIGIAMGVALAIKMQRKRAVVVVGFGEAATDQGLFWEVLNYSALANLPILFMCENNKYSVFSPQEKRSPSDNLAEKASCFGLDSTSLFGNDVMSLYRSVSEKVALIRKGGGPTFIEAYTYRWSSHYGPESDDEVGYRSAHEIEFWKRNCPIKLLEKHLLEKQIIDADLISSWTSLVNTEIDDSFEFAKASPFPFIDDWSEVNISPHSPLADRLLDELSQEESFRSSLDSQIKGY